MNFFIQNTFVIYIIIGLIYTIYNGAIRKIDTEDNPLLPVVWWFLWIFCILARVIGWFQQLYNKRKL